MADVNAHGQWALLAIANEAMQASSNHTSNNAGKDSSGISWSTVLKGFLPMLTIALGFAANYLVETTLPSSFLC
ncbi:unnamed protein product [Aureobasidium vineae]|uniref:Uncharacterized protein n=1 Tax=Aureobasidium vineae TaxID=2773715 RepID=A0A9N8K4D3_9PEZI|nr:unnamed protein product [Aureobasidium vineae]